LRRRGIALACAAAADSDLVHTADVRGSRTYADDPIADQPDIAQVQAIEEEPNVNVLSSSTSPCAAEHHAA
jgi:hypothetical protein